MPKTLLIPVEVNAWVVNDAVLRANLQHPERKIRRWQPNYDNLHVFDAPVVPPAFSGEEPSTTIKKGIYLHWLVPPGFRHGEQDEKKDQEITFPQLPDRWLVIRYSGMDIKNRQTHAWVVESDYKDSKQGSPFPDDKKLGQILVGRKITLGEWQPSIEKGATLNASATGDVTFCVYQPYNENIFSMYDPCFDNDDDNVSYFVSGWYQDDNESPFSTIKTHAQWIEKLERYQLKSAIELFDEDVPPQLLFHGMVCHLTWQPSGPAPISLQDDINLDNLQLTVANTPLEALHTLIIRNDPSIPPGLLNALKNPTLLAKFEHADTVHELAYEVHQDSFVSYPGGVRWQVVKKEKPPQKKGNTTISDELTLKQQEQLLIVNRKQTELEQQQRLLASWQWQLYATWMKLGIGHSLLDEVTAQKLQKAQDDLSAQIKKQQDICDTLDKDVQKSISQLQNEIDLSTEFTLKKTANPPFWQARDPVVLITGIKSPWQWLDDKVLTCRFKEECVSKIVTTTVNYDIKDINIDGGLLTSLTKLKERSFFSSMLALIEEFALFDCAFSSDAFTQAEYIGIPPSCELKRWQQPWLPLFLAWELTWWPIDYPTHWQFDPNEPVSPHYKMSFENLQPKDNLGSSRVLRGKSILLPQASFAFKHQFKTILKQDIQLQSQFPNWQNLINQIDNWDILAQNLLGFNELLTLRDINVHRVPRLGALDAYPNQSVESQIHHLVGEQAQWPPLPGLLAKSSRTIKTRFQSVRSGQFYFNQLSIVDRFGQAIDIVTRELADSYRLQLADTLQPLYPLAIFGDRMRLAQLPPRILQPARLTHEWLTEQSDANDEKSVIIPNPVKAWIIINYLNQSLQIYTATGDYLGELSLARDLQQQDRLIYRWQSGNDALPQTIKSIIANPQTTLVGEFLNALIAQPANVFDDILEMLDVAFSTKTSHAPEASQYLANFVGRPLALALATWQLELQQPAYSDVSWREDPNYRHLTDQNFPVKLGDPDLNQDGLIGYFTETKDGINWSKIYSHYAPSSSPYIEPINKNCFNLRPSFTQEDAFSLQKLIQPFMTALLFDPFSKIHAYTDILPVKIIELSNSYRTGLQKINLNFRVGPLITCVDTATTVDLPTLSKLSGSWTWIGMTESGKDKRDIHQVDEKARLNNTLSYGLIEGQLQRQLDSKSQTNDHLETEEILRPRFEFFKPANQNNDLKDKSEESLGEIFLNKSTLGSDRIG